MAGNTRSGATTALPRVVRVVGAGEAAVNQRFLPRSPQLIPAGFERTCVEMGWPTDRMWDQLSERALGEGSRWWWESEDESYIYYNRGDSQWWIDGPSGAGLYVALDVHTSLFPPKTGWKALEDAAGPAPTVEYVVEDEL